MVGDSRCRWWGVCALLAVLEWGNWQGAVAQPGGFGGGRGGDAGQQRDRLDPEQMDFEDGVATIPDRAAFKRLSYQGPEVMIDRHLSGLEFVKFNLERAGTDLPPQLYFINTKNHRAHPRFMQAVGIGRAAGQMRGVIVYRPLVKAPDGSPGTYTYEFEPNDAFSFQMVKTAYDQLIAKGPLLQGKLAYYPMGNRAQARYLAEHQDYADAGLQVYLDEDIASQIAFLPLNLGTTFGRLRQMAPTEFPGPRDIVVYQNLPNEMPRSAGIITEVRQTPLSHVNLRAVQDRVPNAFIEQASTHPQIKPFLGKFVEYRVSRDGFEIREATPAEVDSHFEKLRPSAQQVPVRDLSVKEIRPLKELQFADSKSYGVKGANLGALTHFDLPEEAVPTGHAIPLYFYDAFMHHNRLYDVARQLIGDKSFLENPQIQANGLKKLRSLIKSGKIPEWMEGELKRLQQQYPPGTPLRCRSSTNNEDLPGFSGAGLYDSFTHRPEEGDLSKTVKQVFASLWNNRAFEEREFYRVDHLQVAMGIVVYPSFKKELSNGVAVTDDVLYQTQGNYYINVQVGEDLVTNPEVASIPEEILLNWNTHEPQYMRSSNRLAEGEHILAPEQLQSLSRYLARIHARFRDLYGKTDRDRFAVEVEFKVSLDGTLVIKQARPWVFGD